MRTSLPAFDARAMRERANRSAAGFAMREAPAHAVLHGFAQPAQISPLQVHLKSRCLAADENQSRASTLRRTFVGRDRQCLHSPADLFIQGKTNDA